jgi:hypothetical protein
MRITSEKARAFSGVGLRFYERNELLVRHVGDIVTVPSVPPVSARENDPIIVVCEFVEIGHRGNDHKMSRSKVVFDAVRKCRAARKTVIQAEGVELKNATPRVVSKHAHGIGD